jgi:hypothetical protein
MLEPDDVIAAATVLAPLGTVGDADARWTAGAPPTSWTAVRTVEHLSDALVFYAGQVARRADRRLPPLRDGRSATPTEHLEMVGTSAHLLAAALRDLGRDRAWHPSGLADAAGWAGMAVTELLVHGADTARALDIGLTPPPGLCRRTLQRVFPWIDPDVDAAPQVLLAVTGRVQLPGVTADPQWWWQSAPLSEWDGRPRRRTVPPAWR